MLRILTAIGWWWCAAGLAAAAVEDKTAYLFCYFTGNGEDGLHFAWSEDGLRWEALANGRSFLTPRIGGKLMRDPCIAQGPDGTFHLVWTTGWWDDGIGYASSKDLRKWSKQSFLPVMRKQRGAVNSWAPEIAWDAAKKRFVVFWSTTVQGKYPATEHPQGDQGPKGEILDHRIYAMEADARVSRWSEPKLMYDPGFNCIDATVVPVENRWLMFFKDETKAPVAKKHILSAWAEELDGPWGEVSPPISRDWVEGPSVLKVGEVWYLYYDVYGEHRYEVMRSRDLRSWELVRDGVSFPGGIRHGTAFAVDAEVVERMKE